MFLLHSTCRSSVYHMGKSTNRELLLIIFKKNNIENNNEIKNFLLSSYGEFDTVKNHMCTLLLMNSIILSIHKKRYRLIECISQMQL